MNTYALLLCGGSGTRMGANENKTLLKIGGVPAIVRCFRAFRGAVKGIVLVARAGEESVFSNVLAAYGCVPLAIAHGGADRQASALNGLKALPPDADIALIHDGARPFVTEEIFCNLTGEESIMISDWPEYKDAYAFPAEETQIEKIKEAVRAIRNIRAEMNVAPSRKAAVFVVSAKDDVRDVFETSKGFFAMLAGASEVTVQADKTGIEDNAVSVVIHDAVIYMPFADLVDVAKEKERLTKEQARLEGEIKRASGMLANERCTSKAPKEKVEEERAKLAKYTETLEQVKERLAQL